MSFLPVSHSPLNKILTICHTLIIGILYRNLTYFTILCDNDNISNVSKLCIKYNLSVNVDSFYRTDLWENIQNTICDCLETYKNIEIYSMHGPFVDLCFGSSDNLIREATEKRFEYTYQVSCKLKINNIVLHNGYIPGIGVPSWGYNLSAKLDKKKQIILGQFFAEQRTGKYFILKIFWKPIQI
jgi:hypothetical protein